ncbi:MAG: SPFH domain-containing protein [Candidatus Promineifilaceae bacterium]
MKKNVSRVKEVVASWNQVRQYLRSGDQGTLVPVVIPRDVRGFRSLMWVALTLYSLLVLFRSLGADGAIGFAPLAMAGVLGFGLLSAITLRSSLIVEIEEGTTGILSSWGEIVRALEPGRQYIWRPWEKVEYIVDTSTEVPYTAPVSSSPTAEGVPLKSIEFFLKFIIVDPVLFVRRIGASNFDIVLSSAVQDAIRQRSRSIHTIQAYSLRGSDVSDMQKILNDTMVRYGVQITGANIPDVQLPDQYQQNLATRERIAKELSAYEKEWDLTRKRRKDTLELEIEQAMKERDARQIAVNEAVNRARQDVALMLQEREAEAEKIRLDIEAAGQARLKSAENEALSLQRLGEAYKDNQALLHYELETQRLRVAQELMQNSPRPLIVNGSADGGNSALNTLVLAQFLPQALKQAQKTTLEAEYDDEFDE